MRKRGKKKILFLYNKYERECWSISLIKDELEKRDCSVYAVGFSEPGSIRKILSIRPHVIVTFPITIWAQKYVYEFIKKATGCIFVTFTTEGLLNYRDKDVIKFWAGNYDYPSSLIDYHAYWGRSLAKALADELYAMGRMRSKRQVRVFGNPMYERDKIRNAYSAQNITDVMQKWKNTVLALTGFTSSQYTLKDIIGVQDRVNTEGKSKKEILADPDLKAALNSVESERIYCQKYIDAVLEAAKKNKDTLFAVKLHPVESGTIKLKRTKLPYIERLMGMDNIFIIKEACPIGLLLPHCNLLVHYGSTVDMEAYIYRIPTLRLKDTVEVAGGTLKALDYLKQEVTVPTYYDDVSDIDSINRYVKKINDGTLHFKKSAVMEKQLYEIMNYREGWIYNPSEKMAEFLCSKLHRNKLRLTFAEWRSVLGYIVKAL